MKIGSKTLLVAVYLKPDGTPQVKSPLIAQDRILELASVLIETGLNVIQHAKKKADGKAPKLQVVGALDS